MPTIAQISRLESSALLTPADVAQTTSPLPQNLDAERALLGAVLLDNQYLKGAAAILKSGDFFLDQHRRVFQQMIAMGETQQAIDLITLTEELKCHGKLEAAGGAAYLAQLVDGVPRVANVEYYATIVKKKSALRQIIHAIDAIQQRAFDEEDIDQLRAYAAASFDGLTQSPVAWEATFGERIIGAKLHFLVHGLIPEGVTFIGGLPESGKTWFLLSIARALVSGDRFLGNFQVPESVPVIYLSPEVGSVSFCTRLDKIGMPNDVKFYFRTQDTPHCSALNDAALLAAVRALKPAVILDTVVRFSAAQDENSAAQNQALADIIFGLRQAGARAVVGAHHQPKAAAEKAPTLENTLRGTGDFGAMCDAVYHLRLIDPDKLGLRVTAVKARDFLKPKPFAIQGEWSGHDGIEFRIVDEGSLGERIVATLEANPRATYRELADLAGCSVGSVRKVATQSGWERQGELWVRNGKESIQ